jgi:hypothetical protein
VLAWLRVERVDGVLDRIGDASADLVVLLASSAPSASGLSVRRKDDGLRRF